jgi:pimeloyl-ACP methyl ester carboxylesterase
VRSFRLPDAEATLRYHDLPGIEPTLVFLHGLGAASSAAFPRVVRQDRLVAHRALLVDFLGFGYSDRPPDWGYTLEEHARAVEALLDALAVCGCVLVGHSMGGSVAILIAAARPDLTGRLIVAEGNLDPGPGTVSGPVAAQSEERYVRKGHSRLIAAVEHEGFAAYAGTLRASDPRGMHRSAVSLIAPRDPSLRDRLYAMSMPHTYVFGTHSLPDPDAEELANHGVRVAVVPNAGHDMMADNPDGFATALAEAMSPASPDTTEGL